MHWADPPFVTGLEHDPAAPNLWHEVFAYFGGESSTDAEFLFVAGIMATLFPWGLGDEKEWAKSGLRMQARAKEMQPLGFASGIFDDRAEYGAYFAHQLLSGQMRTR
jgi:hypothetical protein